MWCQQELFFVVFCVCFCFFVFLGETISNIVKGFGLGGVFCLFVCLLLLFFGGVTCTLQVQNGRSLSLIRAVGIHVPYTAHVQSFDAQFLGGSNKQTKQNKETNKETKLSWRQECLTADFSIIAAWVQLWVTSCWDRCESCVDMLFIKGSGACPECGTALRRIHYRLQVFEDAGVEKEVDIRKRILRE